MQLVLLRKDKNLCKINVTFLNDSTNLKFKLGILVAASQKNSNNLVLNKTYRFDFCRWSSIFIRASPRNCTARIYRRELYSRWCQLFSASKLEACRVFSCSRSVIKSYRISYDRSLTPRKFLFHSCKDIAVVQGQAEIVQFSSNFLTNANSSLLRLLRLSMSRLEKFSPLEIHRYKPYVHKMDYTGAEGLYSAEEFCAYFLRGTLYH